MINDIALQLATAMPVAAIVGAPAFGKIVTPDVIDWSTVRDMGTGQTLYSIVTVRTAITATAGAFLRFSLKLSADADTTPALGGGDLRLHYTQPTVAVIAAIDPSALLVGAQFTMSLTALTGVHLLPPVDPAFADVRGHRFLYGLVEALAIDGITPLAITGGTIDWHFTLQPHTGAIALGSGAIVAQQKSYGVGFPVS